VLETIVSDIKGKAGPDARLVFVSGNFNVVHPGHQRLLTFASECGDFLVVGVTKDTVEGTFIPEGLRLEGVSNLSNVNYSFLLPCESKEFIAALKPDIVVKGKEHENKFNPEKEVIAQYAGQLLFSSGETKFSSLDLLRREFLAIERNTIIKPHEFKSRHDFNDQKLIEIVNQFDKLKVIVVGDLIVDEYVTCEPLGMSQEDPTIVVSPIKTDRFIGGAGIVAGHAAAMGADVKFFSVVGPDEIAEFALDKLKEAGVDPILVSDATRPTSLKKRYRARGKTLLRVSHLRQHAISTALVDKMFSQLSPHLDTASLVIFSDFSYGCIDQSLVTLITERCHALGIPMAADSQSSSQVGDITRFEDMLLITPTEHEARLATRDAKSGLVALIDGLKNTTRAKQVILTLGAEGVLVHSNTNGRHGLLTDQLPAMNSAPKDVAGAGDCLLVATSMALVSGADIWQSAYLGSIAAACQVGRVGNLPLTKAEIIAELNE
jgi:rfaE bifunctional protein kinase chain/domain